MKKILFSLFLILSSISYSAEWSITPSDKEMHIMYKILSPLMVEVSTPKKVILPAQKGTYKYSEYKSGSKGEKVEVKVKAEYNNGMSDDYLKEVYKKVYFKLQNEGDFNLTHTTEANETIKGKGYFVDTEASVTGAKKVTEISKDFSNRLSGDSFVQTTEIDVDFTLEKDAPVMGVYRGTLRLDVWFDHN